jgi:hypothetical protein
MCMVGTASGEAREQLECITALDGFNLRQIHALKGPQCRLLPGKAPWQHLRDAFSTPYQCSMPNIPGQLLPSQGHDPGAFPGQGTPP